MEYHCHSCKKSFKTAKALDKHIVKVHEPKKRKVRFGKRK